VPPYIPTSAHDGPPDFRHITRTASDANLKRLRKYTLFDVDFSQPSPPSAAGPSSGTGTAPSAKSAANVKNITISIAQQEKEFQKAVQPGSPISALLSSARQPLLMTNSGANGNVRESPLLRKLQTVKESPLGRRAVTRALDGTIEERELTGRRRPIAASSQDGDYEEEELRLRKKELEAQKARIVAQMAPVREELEEENGHEDAEQPHVVLAKQKEVPKEKGGALVERENIAPSSAVPSNYASLRAKDRIPQPLQQASSSRAGLMDKENKQITGSCLVPPTSP